MSYRAPLADFPPGGTPEGKEPFMRRLFTVSVLVTALVLATGTGAAVT